MRLQLWSSMRGALPQDVVPTLPVMHSAIMRMRSAAVCTVAPACRSLFFSAGPHQVCGEQARRRARAQIMLASSWGLKRCQWRKQYRLMACSSSAPG